MQKLSRIVAVLLAAVVVLAVLGWYVLRSASAPATAPGAAASGAGSRPGAPAVASDAVPAKPALTVTTTTVLREHWAESLEANGSIAAWQETVVGAEYGGDRLTEVLVNVGDRVRRGQVLAQLAVDTVRVEVAQARAALAEADAALAEARANADRARRLEKSGAISAQQIQQYLTGAQTAEARVAAQRAALATVELRRSKTRITAPDDGVISARLATVGAVVQPGNELFRLIRGGRLEWRAEVTAAELARLRPGRRALLTTPDGSEVEGRVRIVAPTVDPQSRNGLVYVDLPAEGPARAGMFARGRFELDTTPALTLPQSAVLLRDGFSYAFVVGEDRRVTQTKVAIGRRVGERIEILSGLPEGARVVESGGGFLADRDLVRVVTPGEPAAAAR